MKRLAPAVTRSLDIPESIFSVFPIHLLTNNRFHFHLDRFRNAFLDFMVVMGMDTNKLTSLRPLYMEIIENVAPKRST